MKLTKRLISIILALLMIISGAPLSVFAATPLQYISGYYESPEDEAFNLRWNYTAATDTLYLDAYCVQSLANSAQLPLYYKGQDDADILWTGTYSNVVISNNTVELGEHCLGTPCEADNDGLMTVNVSFEENSMLESIYYMSFEAYSIDELIIPDTVVYIDSYAFSNSEFNYIQLPNPKYGLCIDMLAFEHCTFDEFNFNNCRINSIPQKAFESSVINNIQLPNTVKTIDSYAFHDAEINCDFTIPDSVETINHAAFINAKIKALNFGKNISFIGDSAFENCQAQNAPTFKYNTAEVEVAEGAFYRSNINIIKEEPEATIDDELKDISGYYDSSLEGYDLYWEYDVETDTLYLDSENIKPITYEKSTRLPLVYKNASGNDVLWIGSFHNVVFSKNVIKLHPSCLGFMKNGPQISISFEEGSNLKAIGKSAFAQLKLGSISLPNSVETIEEEAFTNCTADEIILPDSIYNIESKAFYQSNINYIKLPNYKGDKTPELGSRVFYYCKNIAVDLSGYNIETIGERCFYRTQIKSICFPSTLKTIGSYAFQHSTFENDLYVPDSVETIEKHAFNGTHSSKEKAKLYLGKSVKTIRGSAFSNVKFGGGIIFAEESNNIELGASAFAGDDFTHLDLSKFSAIGSRAFYSCSKLVSISSDSAICNLESIGDYAFQDCLELKTVNIPDSVKTIGKYAFYRCTALTDFVTNEESQLQSIGVYIFNYCTALKNVVLNKSLEYIGGNAFEECSSLKEIDLSQCENLSIIYSNAFIKCAVLERVVLPESLTSIKNGAFMDCPSLESVNIPDSITTIEKETFKNDVKLNITIPNTVKTIGDYAFENCESQKSVPRSITDFGCLSFKNTGIKTLDYSFLNESIIIRQNAFENCKSLESVNFTQSYVALREYAFCGCTSLSQVTLPSNLTDLPNACFKLTDISSISFPHSMKTIGVEALAGTPIRSIYISNNIKEIGSGAFKSCYFLSSVEFENRNSRLKIYSYAFAECSFLSSIMLPYGIESISNYCFYNSVLSAIVLPETLSSIGNSAFANTILSEITIPDNVTSINEKAFEGCYILKRINFGEDSALESIGASAFANCKLSSVSLPSHLSNVGERAFADNPLKTLVVNGKSTNLEKQSAFFNTELNAFDPYGIIYGHSPSLAENYATRNHIGFTVLTSGIEPDPDEPDEPESPDEPTTQPDGSLLNGSCSNGSWNISLSSKNVLYINAVGKGKIKDANIIDNAGNSKTFAQLADEFEIEYVYINEGVSELPDYFMYSETGVGIKFVCLPDSLKSIGKYAFAKTSVIAFYNSARANAINNEVYYSYIPQGVTYIGDYAFAYTDGLQGDFYLPRDLTEISEGLFYNSCTIHVEMYGKVTKINKKAFAECSDMLTLYIPCSVEEIYTDENPENNAFGYCDGGLSTNLWVIGREGSAVYDYCNENNIHFSHSLGKPYRSGKFTDYNSSTTNGTINWEYYIEDNQLVLSAGNNKNIVDSYWQKFYEYNPNTDKTELVVTLLEEKDLELIDLKPDKVAFDRVYEFTAPDLLSIFNPKEIEFRTAVRKVGLYTFANCTRIEELYLPTSLYYAGDYCFENCTSLKKVRLGYCISTIANGMFSECRKLESVDLGNVVLQSIGEKAFYNCNALKFVNLQNQTGYNNGSIGEKAFYNCVNLQEIFIPDNIKYIEPKAFYNCVQVQKITLSGNVTRIEKDAFANLFYCESITINSEVNPAAFSKEKDIFANLGAYTNGIELNIGNSVENVDFKFFEELNVTSVNFGANVNSISNRQYLSKLKNVSVAEGSAFSVKNNCLYSGNCLVLAPQGLTQVEIASDTKGIDDYALYGTGAKSITLPDSVEALGEYCFANSKALVGITLSDSIIEIPEGAFSGCEKLRLANLPESTFVIKKNAYENCTSLISVVFNNSLSIIAENAFNGCVKLEGLAFPENLVSIGNGAFANCSGLKYAYIWNASIGENAFANDEKLNIFTPVGTDAYRYAREFNIPYSAYTDEELFFDEWAIKIDALAGYLGYCEEGGHGSIQYLTVYEADCENDGFVIGVCEYCSEILEEIHINACGHSYKVESSVPATATTKGITVSTCEHCNQSITEYTDPLDENIEIQTHTVCGTVELSSNKTASQGIAPAKNASIVIDNMVVATTGSDGRFCFELETGAYQAQIEYAYGFTRNIYFIVKNKDIVFTEPIIIIGCDFSKDGIINDEDIRLFQMIISAKKDDPSYLSFVDLNADGYINAKDLLYIKALNGLEEQTFKYPLLIIS